MIANVWPCFLHHGLVSTRPLSVLSHVASVVVPESIDNVAKRRRVHAAEPCREGTMHVKDELQATSFCLITENV